MKQCNHTTSGFTLIELLVGLSITVFLILVIFGLLMSGLKTGQSAQAKESLQNTTVLVLNDLVQELRWSNAGGRQANTANWDDLIVTTSQYGATDQLVTYGVDTTERLFRQIEEDVSTRKYLTPEKVRVERFNIEDVSFQEKSPYPLLKINLSLKPKNNQSIPPYLSSLVVSVRKREVEF